MKLPLIWSLCLAGIVMAGCYRAKHDPIDEHAANVLMANTYSDVAIDNAILAQHILFPYHFVNDGAALNELGRRDLGVLAAHYKEHPGTLNVHRGDAPAALYADRLAEVRKALTKAGVKEKRITLADGLPGGEGMASEQVLKILAREAKDSSKTSYTIPTTGTSGQSSGGYSGQSIGK
jgi:hypothetical protein